METPRRFRLGAATVTLISVGDLQASISAWFDRPEGDAASRYAADFASPTRLPIYCAHIALGARSLLVDAGVYDDIPQSDFAMPGDYHPPPSLSEQLAQIGVAPEAVTDVVLTHRHFDHLNGTTHLATDGNYVPRFPHARHYLGRADFDDPDIQAALHDPASLAGRTLAVLHRHGLLAPVDGDLTLDDAFSIVATPGETPGHQILRLHSEGQTLYILGDLIHHPIEIEQPTVMVDWAQPETTLAGRRALAAAALSEGALLLATHIRKVGRLRGTPGAVIWESVDDRTLRE